MNCNMTLPNKSAIVGYWRSGANIVEIFCLMEFQYPESVILEVLKDYGVQDYTKNAPRLTESHLKDIISPN